MGSIIPLSIAGVVLAFLIAVLADFPIESAFTLRDSSDESYSVEAVEEVGSLFTGNYNAIINELVSYQTNPDYARAEARRQDMLDLGNRLTVNFTDFQTRLESEFDILMAQAEELESSTETTTSE
ncbi:MAG: hypothetical protein IIC23_09455 [Chloroflexi bacterium]|nr:hypothetical protein [Chloroflexota bacterium]MCH9039607.1 hypothetical protein [Chloroflexota bacterium]MCI0812430.1 hypothetical protein [Chloroflexota bacterium]